MLHLRMHCAGTVCVPPGTYMVMKDINLDINGVTVTSPSGATIRYGNNMQFFVRGNGNKLQNLNVDCANTAFSGFVINGAGNSINDCSVRRRWALCTHAFMC